MYDKTAWGKDTIAATKGTMTLVLSGLKSTDIKWKDSGTTRTIWKTAATSQKIIVKGWNAATHSIKYGTATQMKAFTTYVNAASPTAAQKTAAQNAVWKVAKLAS